MGLFHDWRDRVGWTDRYDGLGICGAHGVGGATYIRGLPFVGSNLNRLCAMCFECRRNTSENGRAEGIFRVDNPNLVITELVPHTVHLLARFVVVRGAHIDNPMTGRGVERLGAGEQAD